MKKLTSIFFLVLISLVFGSSLFGQTQAFVEWKCMPPDSQNVSATQGNISGLPETSSPGFVVRDYNNGPGPDQRWWPYANGAAVSWGGETAKVKTRWVQFAASPNPNFSFQVDTFSVYIGAKGTSALRASVWYDTDTSFNNATLLSDSALVLKADSDSLYKFVLNKELVSGETIYFRIYPWYTGSNSTSKYLYLRNSSIIGTSKGLTYPASALWELTNPSSGGTGLTVSTTGQVDAQDELLNNTEVNQYTGIEGAQRVRIKGNSWPANQTSQIDSVYIQFSVAPKTGYNFYVNSVSLRLGAASINTMKANIYYSTDSTFATSTMIDYQTSDVSGNNYIDISILQEISASLNMNVESGRTFYLRIYPWVDNDPAVRTGKYVTLQNVMIGGEIEGTPTPASALWPFITDDSPVTNGSVVAVNSTYSDKMKLYSQLTDLPDQNSVSHHCGAVQTASKSWYAESAPTDSLWFQYQVSPKFGGTFFVDHVSLYLGGWFSSNLKAEVVYSKDSSFSTETVLVADTSLVGNAVMKLSASLDETVNSGETFYLRVKPYNTKAEGWAKLVAVDSVLISGTTVGVTADIPTVTTSDVESISTTFAKSGGNVSTDGGSTVTAKGVCWNTTGSPTILDSKTFDGSGSGSFVSIATELVPGTKYYLRAYATNDAGTAYGNEVWFTTLDAKTVPTVITTPISNILVKTAESGGNVTAWGGDTVIVRGVCWNTTGEPTISNSKTENGSGLESFTSILYPLDANTTYYVRAYATNSIGTGYGLVDTFKTQLPAPAVRKVVAKDGSGDYSTIQAAFDGVPELYTGTYKIFVKKGTYKEKLLLGSNKVNVILEGEDRDNTILTYDDYAAITGGTSTSYSVGIDAADFTAINITFQNTYKNDQSISSQQAVALRSNGDRQAFYNCNLLGYQDTYYAWGGSGAGRVYMKDCYIEGSVDFIFGRDIVLFDSCEVHVTRNKCSITAANTDPKSKFGFVFKDCIISYDSVGFDGDIINKIYLGRAWQASPRTVFINTYEPGVIDSLGWNQQPINSGVVPALYGVYQGYGPGYNNTGHGQGIGAILTSNEAADYTLENIFSKNSDPGLVYDWIPVKPIVTGIDGEKIIEKIPVTYELSQNYPNPFNPTTTIKYALPNTGMVKINIFNILGENVITLVEKEQAAGRYEINFNASKIASGIYFYRIQAGSFIQTKKMILLK